MVGFIVQVHCAWLGRFGAVVIAVLDAACAVVAEREKVKGFVAHCRMDAEFVVVFVETLG